MLVRIRSEVPGQRRNVRRLRRALKRSMRRLEVSECFEVSVMLAGEREMGELNLNYRGVEGLTDVLAFPQFTAAEVTLVSKSGPTEPLGDIVICVPVAERQAMERGLSLAEELELLAVHGLLHLLGYTDSCRESAQEMALMESLLLDRAVLLDRQGE